MSTDIIFDRHVAAVRGKNRTLYALFEEHGSNNTTDFNNRIARNWSCLTFGSYRDVLKVVTKMAGGCEGGMLQHGSKGSDTYRPISSGGFVNAWMKAIDRAAHHVAHLPAVVPLKNRWQDVGQALKYAAAASAAHGTGAVKTASEVTFNLGDPLQAETFALYGSEHERTWPDVSVSATRYPLETAGQVEPHEVLTKKHAHRPLCADYALVTQPDDNEYDRRYIDLRGPINSERSYEIAGRLICRRAEEMIDQGFDPVSVIRYEQKAVKAMSPSTGTVTFAAAYANIRSDYLLERFGFVPEQGQIFTMPLQKAVLCEYAFKWDAETTSMTIDGVHSIIDRKNPENDCLAQLVLLAA